jgi:hypothetical protein
MPFRKNCRWSCAKCEQQGTSKVWIAPGEAVAASVRRYEQQTRERCIPGCQFMAGWPAAREAQGTDRTPTVNDGETTNQPSDLHGTPSQGEANGE